MNTNKQIDYSSSNCLNMSKVAVTIYIGEKYVKEHTLAIQEPPSSKSNKCQAAPSTVAMNVAQFSTAAVQPQIQFTNRILFNAVTKCQTSPRLGLNVCAIWISD